MSKKIIIKNHAFGWFETIYCVFIDLKTENVDFREFHAFFLTKNQLLHWSFQQHPKHLFSLRKLPRVIFILLSCWNFWYFHQKRLPRSTISNQKWYLFVYLLPSNFGIFFIKFECNQTKTWLKMCSRDLDFMYVTLVEPTEVPLFRTNK